MFDDRKARHREQTVSAGDLPAELSRIASLDTSALRSYWLKLSGVSPSRQLNGDMLRRMVMHHVQELCLGSLDRKFATILDRIAGGGGDLPLRLRVGSVLVREHAGSLHQVIVVPNGFAWNDQTFPSLSAVAKAITGTKWNGRRFFGLRNAATDKSPVEANP